MDKCKNKKKVPEKVNLCSSGRSSSSSDDETGRKRKLAKMNAMMDRKFPEISKWERRQVLKVGTPTDLRMHFSTTLLTKHMRRLVRERSLVTDDEAEKNYNQDVEWLRRWYDDMTDVSNFYQMHIFFVIKYTNKLQCEYTPRSTDSEEEKIPVQSVKTEETQTSRERIGERIAEILAYGKNNEEKKQEAMKTLLKEAISKKFDLSEAELESVLQWGTFQDLLRSRTKSTLLDMMQMRGELVSYFLQHIFFSFY